MDRRATAAHRSLSVHPMFTRRGVATFALFLGGIATGGVVMAQSSADALSTGYGGAEQHCALIGYSYPQYGISGFYTYCGVSYHAGGPNQ